MPEPLISVIVPVYKTLPYLERCIRSICNQTYTNLEIILIDDGSPDRCGALCDQFALSDPRIQVIHTENHGQAAARNSGLEASHGAFIGFVDSDDWILPQMYETLLQCLFENHADIACCGIGRFRDETLLSYFNPNTEDRFVLCTEDAQLELIQNYRITSSPCDKLYRREIFDGEPMQTGVIYEDLEVMPRWIGNAKNVAYIGTPFYCYEQGNESTMRGHFSLRQYDMIRACEKRLTYYENNFPACIPWGRANLLETMLACIEKSTGIPEWNSLRKELISTAKKNLPPEAERILPRKTKMKRFFLRIHPAVYILFMRIYHLIQPKP